MSTRALRLLTLFCLCATQPLAAQEQIPLDEALVNRLGLVFTRLEAADGSSGTRFPATVIASPLASTVVTARHAGTLERWLTRPGATIQPGEALALVRSPDVLALQQEWRAADAAAAQAEVTLARDRRLFEAGVIAEQRLLDSQRFAEQADFQRRALQAALQQAGMDTTDLAALASGTAEPGLYRVRAPMAGTVGSLEHDIGEAVAVGELLLRLNSEEQWLRVRLPASVAAGIREGDMLQLLEGEFRVEVRQIAQALDTATQTAEVLGVLPAGSGLLPGRVVTLLVPPRANGVLVPADAVVHNGGDTVVYVRNSAGVEARTLDLVPAGGDYLATAGIRAGDTVVVRGAALLKGISLGLGGE